MKITRIGLDLAKNIFQVHGVDVNEQVVIRKQLKRKEMLSFFARLEPCLIGMEACGGAHYWARELVKLGHDARLMNPSFVKPYVKSNKNDVLDAEAICEAVSRPSMRFVPIKMIEQQDVLSVHRARSLLIKQRTALANQIRGLLAEYGIVVAQHLSKLKQALPIILEDGENQLSVIARELFADLLEQLRHLDNRVADYDKKIAMLYRSNETCQRLGAIEGIGPAIATALVALAGDGQQFKNGREFAAYLGLTPRQHSSGGKQLLMGISKRGDKYVRSLLIHGARAALRVAPNKTDARSRWVCQLSERRNKNIAAVGLANKNARIALAIIRDKTSYRYAA